MIEVEAKVRLHDLNLIRKKIKEIARFIKIENKIDDYYTLDSLKKYPHKSIRIRKRNKTFEINFKQRISFNRGIYAKNEHEFILHDIDPFLNLIKDFGFKHWLRKEKKTELYQISKNFHIEINNVKNLGLFLEIEYLCEKKDIKKARISIGRILRFLSIEDKDLIAEGYTKILWGKQK